MSDLREKLTKLANSVPSLREHLVPILKEATDFPSEEALKGYDYPRYAVELKG